VVIADQQTRLTMEDAQALEDRGEYINAVQPEMNRNLQITWSNKNAQASVVGTSSNYLEVRKYKLMAGRMFTRQEDEAKQRLAVVGPAVATNMGLSSSDALLGENIRIRGIQFTVIGVLESKGQASPFGNPDEQILIPITTGRFRVFGSDRLRSISVIAQSEERIPDAMASIQKVLRREHRLRTNQPDDFQMRGATDFLATQSETMAVFTMLLSGIAAVSLLVGGIGIMNIMLVSVTERTREIGVRKALGATRNNILLQFMIEALVLCCLGGILGIAIGSGGAMVMNKMAGWTAQLSIPAIGLAFAFSAFVGLAFGVWPARRAATLDPIVALRYE
jgi:putative ABC transport system permease protein